MAADKAEPRLAELDLSRIEARIVCYFQPPAPGTPDLYTQAAAHRYGIPPAQVTPEQRAQAKQEVFRKLYTPTAQKVL